MKAKAKSTALDAYAHHVANFVPEAPKAWSHKPSRTKSLADIPPIEKGQIYITREQVRIPLRCSLMSVARLDRAGKLKPAQWNKKSKNSTSKKYYLLADVLAFAEKMKREGSTDRRRKVAV